MKSIKSKIEVYKMHTIVDDKRYEGFGLQNHPSLLGNDDLIDDMTPAYGVPENIRVWEQVKLSELWKTPTVIGHVSKYHDYPCIGLIFPAFSSRACEALKLFLEPNGELLPLKHKTGTFYFYNITTIADVLDRETTICDWHDPPNIVLEIQHYGFIEKRLRPLSIFRFLEDPLGVYVTKQFVSRAIECNLKGFTFSKVWPLPKDKPWDLDPIILQ